MEKLLDGADDATWTYRSGAPHATGLDVDMTERFLQ